MKIDFGRFKMEFEYTYADGSTELIVFLEPTDEIMEKPFGDEKKEDEQVSMKDFFTQVLRRCIQCENFEKFIKDVKSKTTVDKVFIRLKTELGKLEAKA